MIVPREGSVLSLELLGRSDPIGPIEGARPRQPENVRKEDLQRMHDLAELPSAEPRMPARRSDISCDLLCRMLCGSCARVSLEIAFYTKHIPTQ